MKEITGATVVRAAERQLSSVFGDEAVVLGLDRGVYYGLDEVGARIWKMVQEPTSVTAICDAIVEEFDVESDRCEQDVISLLVDLRKESLVEVVTP